MAPWTFNIKLPYDTEFTFGSLMFTAREDGNLELLTRGPAPKHLASVYGQVPYLGQFIYIRRGMIRFQSLCRVVQSRCQNNTTALSRGTHLLAIGRNKAPLHQERPLIMTSLTITLRSGVAPARTPQKRVASSSWWPR
jgi:hypothetical protein